MQLSRPKSSQALTFDAKAKAIYVLRRGHCHQNLASRRREAKARPRGLHHWVQDGTEQEYAGLFDEFGT